MVMIKPTIAPTQPADGGVIVFLIILFSEKVIN